MVPFICGLAADFALCAEAPAEEDGEAVLVAEAYDLTGSCAGTAPDDGAVDADEGEGALLVVLAGLGELAGRAVVMSGLGGLSEVMSFARAECVSQARVAEWR